MTRKITKAVFPVAGLGTRFLPATKAMPKEMLTVVHKPIIQYAVEEALAAGITELIFVTGRGKDALENHFDHPYELADTLRKKNKLKELEELENMLPEGVRIYYTRQGSPLGLGHAVHCASGITQDEPFAVLLPDDILAEKSGEHTLSEMVKLYEETGKSVVLCEEVPEERTKNYGIIKPAGAISGRHVSVAGFVEKPKAEDAPSRLGIVGRYILTPAHMQQLAKGAIGAGGEIQLTDAMTHVCEAEGYSALISNAKRFDCGDKVGFQMANLHFALKDEYIAPRLLSFVHQMAAEHERREEPRTA
ncbi:MAG: UTP--glucose-1-phosphate uridylyltransferase [Alphaproteobacteria bacterium CG_4_10_14_0_8_um_filter_53_9]|nr:MAG: UTP--glucose-1-phosphate uridylyltransferase [Alphaproteobacteria bacterium CG_4_10_14_0_8_um_filter_53_9]